MEKKDKSFYIMMSVLIVAAACLPVYGAYCIGGHDVAYHLLRIEALKTGILAGRPFLKVNMLFFGGMGYASSLFYPDFLLYIPALFRCFGMSIDLSYNLFVVFCIACGFASCYFGVHHITGRHDAAFAAAAIFTLYQYHIDDIYTRAAVGEYTAVIFVPLIFAGLYDLMYEGKQGHLLLFAGMTGVILCHTITTILCLVLCLVFFAVNIKKMAAEPKRPLAILVTALLVLAVTSFYWLPVLEQFATGAFATDTTYFNLDYESKLPVSVFMDENTGTGIIIWLLLLTRFLVRKDDKDDSLMGFADICTLMAAVFTIGVTTLVPWAHLQGILGFMQFPWRMLIITGPLLAFSEGIYISRIITAVSKDEGADIKSRAILLGVSAVMLFSCIGNLQRNDQTYYSYSDDYYDYIPFTGEVIGGEWLPKAVNNREALIDSCNTAVTDKGENLEVVRQGNELGVNGLGDDTEYVDVPFIYYKGYRALDTDGGAALPVTGEGDNGRARVYTDGSEGIRVYYAGTVIQHASAIVSIVTVLVLAAWLILTCVRDPHFREGASQRK